MAYKKETTANLQKFTIYIDEQLLDKCKELAEHEERSVSSLFILAVKNYIRDKTTNDG